MDLHLIVEAIVKDEIVCQADPVGLHWMAWPHVVIPQLHIVKVGDLQHTYDLNSRGAGIHQVNEQLGHLVSSRASQRV